MTNYEDIRSAEDWIIKCWGDTGKNVIQCAFEEHKIMPMGEFVYSCTACGGDWGAMLLTGIKDLYPKTYAAIPEHMGQNAFSCICETLLLLGVVNDSN